MIRSARSAALVAAALVLLAACQKPPKTDATNASTAPTTSATTPSAAAQEVTIDPALLEEHRIVLQTAEARTPASETLLPATVEPGEGGTAEVTSLAAGRVASLPVAVGDAVTKGQALAWVESPAAGRAQADLLRARGRATLAARALARQVELEGQAATSKAALDEARAEDEAARADLAAARTVLAGIGAAPAADPSSASSTIVLRAPIAGVVVERAAVLGGPVSENQVLFRLVAQDKLVVVAHVPETSTLVPQLGDAVALSARGDPDRRVSCTGTVAAMLPWVDAARTRSLRIAPAAGCALVPGAFVEARVHDRGIATDGGAKIWVPTNALIEVHGVSGVFVPAPSGAAGAFVLRPLRLGATSGDDTEVLSGLAAGERFVGTGSLLLKGEALRKELQ